MVDIDQIRIQFSPENLKLLNASLAFIMFGIALDIRLRDFRHLFNNPKPIVVGLTSQWVLLPILTLTLVWLFEPGPSVALGMVLVASCPGGNVSNYATHLARGNTALSITMTSIVTLASLVMTPVLFALCASLTPGTQPLLKSFSLDPLAVIWTILQLIVIPLLAGMYLAQRFPAITRKIHPFTSKLSMVLFLGIVVAALGANLDNLLNHLHLVFFLVMVHNGLALTMGFSFARLNRLSGFNSRAVAIETGIQNSGLGLILIFNFFNGLGGMAMIAAWWGIWHLISSFSLAMWWRRRFPDTQPFPVEGT